jgi:hypothetical protein
MNPSNHENEDGHPSQALLSLTRPNPLHFTTTDGLEDSTNGMEMIMRISINGRRVRNSNTLSQTHR